MIDIVGVKISTLIASFIGSAVSLSYTPKLSKTQAAVSVLSGSATAVYSYKLVMHYTSLPPEIDVGLCFLIGLVAMRAIPALFEFVGRLGNAAIPGIPQKEKDDEK